jgi:hypothetical protein
VLTRVAVSEHTIANGFNEDIAYYGDSVGNVTVVWTTNLNLISPTPTSFTMNLPTILNVFGSLNSDDVIVFLKKPRFTKVFGGRVSVCGRLCGRRAQKPPFLAHRATAPHAIP